MAVRLHPLMGHLNRPDKPLTTHHFLSATSWRLFMWEAGGNTSWQEHHRTADKPIKPHNMLDCPSRDFMEKRTSAFSCTPITAKNGSLWPPYELRQSRSRLDIYSVLFPHNRVCVPVEFHLIVTHRPTMMPQCHEHPGMLLRIASFKCSLWA